MYKVGKIAALLLAFVGIHFVVLGQTKPTDLDSKPYRLLFSKLPMSASGFPVVKLVVSVDEDVVPEGAGIKTLVCSVVDHEKIPSHKYLWIEIFHKLETYNPESVDGSNLTHIDGLLRQQERMIAEYQWYSDGDPAPMLTVIKDKSGSLTPWKRYPFDHAKECPVRR